MSTRSRKRIDSAWFWFPDPWRFADWFVGPIGIGSSNYGVYNSTVVNALLAKADATVDPQQRSLIYQQVDEIVYQDASDVWVAQFQNAVPLGLPVGKLQTTRFHLRPTIRSSRA